MVVIKGGQSACKPHFMKIQENILHKIVAHYLLRYEINDILNIWRKRITDWLNQSINYKVVCKTPGLLMSDNKKI